MKIRILAYLMFATLNTALLIAPTDCYSAQAHDIHCAPQLQNSLKAINHLKEGKKLISNVLKEGSIRISVAKTEPSKRFGACWDPDTRTIFIDLYYHTSQGELIGSIVFELHNALRDSELQYLSELAYHGKIDKDKYVQGVEYIEYQNSIDAAGLIQIGIKNKIFSETANLFVYSSFDEYFYYQKQSGHSAVIAGNFDNMAPRKR